MGSKLMHGDCLEIIINTNLKKGKEQCSKRD